MGQELILRDGILAAAPILVAAALVFGPTSAWLAARRGRNPALWLALGALLGPIALLLLQLAPPARCPACAEPTGGFEADCRTCGARLRVGAREPARTTPPANATDRPAEPPRATAGAPTGAIEAGIGIAAATPSILAAAAANTRAATTRAARQRAARAAEAPAGPTGNHPTLRAVPEPESHGFLAAGASSGPTGITALPPTRMRTSRASTAGRDPERAAGSAGPIEAGAAVASTIPAGGPTQATGAGIERLSAIGVRRPDATPQPATAAAGNDRPGVVILAIGVYVQGSEPLLAGSRYLIARTDEKLMIIGPVDPTASQMEIDFPLAGVEANYIADRLVISGPGARAGSRPFAIAFRSVAGLVSTPVDQAIMERDGRLPLAAGRS